MRGRCEIGIFGRCTAAATVFLLGILLFAACASATSPYFNQTPPDTLNLQQDVVFYYKLNGTDPDNELPLTFSNNAASLGWSVFAQNNGTGEINFTPRNNDVGHHQISLILQDSHTPTPEGSLRIVDFNVSNKNDPPNITQYNPANLSQVIFENNSMGFTFNYNATDPDQQWGDVLQNIWIIDGDNQSDSKNLTSFTFQPGFCEPSNRLITLVVWDLDGLNDSVTWNITIVNVNRPPEFNWSSPIQDKTWVELSNLTNNISLDDYFYDPDITECGVGSLNFTAAGNSSIRIAISTVPPHNVSFIPAYHWFGEELVNITAFDGYNYTTSNNFLLNVTYFSEPQTITPIPDQTAYAFAPFAYQVNIINYNVPNAVEYFDNTSLFNINNNTGLISFTPGQDVVGNYSIMINVTNELYNVFAIFNLTIFNNSKPVVDPISDQSGTQGIYFSLTVNAMDPDNDPITFSTNFARMTTPASSNSTGAIFSFTPRQSDVGTRPVTLTATDAHGASSQVVFNLEIQDVNTAPVLEAIPTPIIVKIGKNFSMQLNATDDDDTDVLSFAHNASAIVFPHFAMNSSGWMNFTVNASDLGNHSVVINVTDNAADQKSDSQAVMFIVTYNRNPVIYPVGTQNASEDVRFTLQMNATDADSDPLYFYSNSTLFNISASGLINFTPTQAHFGFHQIMVNVSDGDGGWGNFTLMLNVSQVNDPPYFDPPLLNYSIWSSIYEDSLIEIYINATDEENDALIFNLTILMGPGSFNITNISRNQALLNFTPNQAMVGNYSVNFTVSDGMWTNHTVVNFTIHNVNDAPVILAIYPYGTPLAEFTVFDWANKSFFPSARTSINASEDMDITFNATVYDEDNETLSYNWSLDGTAVSLGMLWRYEINFSSAGTHTIQLRVNDSVSSDSMTWNISVNNTNRLPVFGAKSHASAADLSQGSVFQANMSGGLVSLAHSGGNFYSSGTYNSTSMDLDMLENFVYTTIEWDATVPQNTTMYIRTRSSSNEVIWESWSSWIDMAAYNSSTIESESYKYIQYQVNLSTQNGSVTPWISRVSALYEVADKTLPQNQDLGVWIDLDAFFTDPDGEFLNYSVSGAGNVEVRIDNNTHLAGLYPLSVGSDTLTISAMDSSGSSSESNQIVITISQPIGLGNAGAGDSGSRVITRTIVQPQEKKVTEYVNLDIVVPEAITTYRNSTIVVPIRLRNTGKDVLERINLSASSNSTGLEMEFTKSVFARLGPEEEVKTNLILTSADFLGNYEVIVRADVQSPKFSDYAKIILNTLERGELNKSQLDTKITFTRDLLLANPECLELTEQLKQASAEILNADYAKANELIEEAIRECQYLVMSKENIKEKPTGFDWIFEKLFKLTSKNRVLTYVGVIVAVFTLLTLSLMIERIRKRHEVKKSKH